MLMILSCKIEHWPSLVTHYNIITSYEKLWNNSDELKLNDNITELTIIENNVQR